MTPERFAQIKQKVVGKKVVAQQQPASTASQSTTTTTSDQDTHTLFESVHQFKEYLRNNG